MAQPTFRRVASVLAAVLAVAAGLAGWLVGPDALRGDRLAANGVPLACPPSGVASVSLSGPDDARFAVDGVEVPAYRNDGPPGGSSAVLTGHPAQYVPCGGEAHRYAIVTATPGGCRWAVAPVESQAEALGDHGMSTVTDSDCSVVIGA